MSVCIPRLPRAHLLWVLQEYLHPCDVDQTEDRGTLQNAVDGTQSMLYVGDTGAGSLGRELMLHIGSWQHDALNGSMRVVHAHQMHTRSEGGKVHGQR